MKISFVDLSAQYLRHKSEIDGAINQIISKTAFIGGTAVKEFENSFATANGIKHCITVANGTDAIYITLKMLGIGYGDEVITTSSSWISTPEAISQTGAKPVFVDIDSKYYTIDVSQIEEKINERTKAILPVHLYGQPAEMDKITQICNNYGLMLVEDCAQAHFARYRNQLVGTFGDAAIFSFYPGKNLGAYGDAGAIITNNDELATKCRMYANHGALVKHTHLMEGVNSRMDGIQAAILNVKLPFINEWNEKRLQIAYYYNKLFENITQVATPIINPLVKHVFHVYCIRIEDRDSLCQYLKEYGIQTAIHYPVALPNMPAYSYLGHKPTDFPIVSEYQHKILSLPIYPELSKDGIHYIFNTIREYYEKK